MADMEDYGSESKNSNTNDKIESEVAKVKVGDNFVVIVEEWENGNPFFVVLCDKALHHYEATFKDGWGNKWYKSDMLPSGIWYHHMLGQKGPNTIYVVNRFAF
jgi:hypothetical protein